MQIRPSLRTHLLRANFVSIQFFFLFLCCSFHLAQSSKYGGPAQVCPRTRRYGKGPSRDCQNGPVDPNLKPRVRLEKWFTRKIWEDLFPVSNQGWGQHPCLPYSYDSFIIAARYFPQFGGATHSRTLRDSPFTLQQLQRRDVAAFFAHVLAETGLNNLGVYNQSNISRRLANECFYRGGFYHFFEGGPRSYLFAKRPEGDTFRDGETCHREGRYCRSSPELDFWYPCKQFEGGPDDGNSTSTFGGCYFGRGPLQLSWNYNYGQFQHFLRTENIDVDLLNKPNQLVNRLDPPLAMLSALWFYMTPQPPKPSMHQIMMGNWVPSELNHLAGYNGSVFGPTNLVINHECTGEDHQSAMDDEDLFPGKGGENRRIKAFKWFCDKLGVKPGPEKTQSCKEMPETFATAGQQLLSWQPDWSNMWKSKPCDCVPARFAGVLPYFDPRQNPGKRWAKENERNRLRCVYAMYNRPELHRMDFNNSPCLQHPVKIKLSRFGLQ